VATSIVLRLRRRRVEPPPRRRIRAWLEEKIEQAIALGALVSVAIQYEGDP
jgi:hypothetical protein